MAVITNTYLTYSSADKREDLTDIITNISPRKTPFLSRMRSVNATGVTHEWQTQELEAASAANAVVEGNDATFPAVTASTRLTNTCQISAKYLIVSKTQEIVNKAGLKSEVSFQMAMRSLELATDMESSLLQNTAAVIGGTSTARQLKGVAGFITTNSTAKAAADLAQPDIDNSMSDIWNEGGEGKLLLCHSHNKKIIAGFTTGVTKNLDAEDKRLVHSVDVYEPPIGGVVEVVPDHFITTSTVNILDPDLWAVAYLRRPMVDVLAQTGDALKRQLIVEYTLQSRQEKGNAEITGTSTS